MEKPDHVNDDGVALSRQGSARWSLAARSVVVAWALLTTGCAAHLQGVVEPARGGPRLVTSDGARVRLLLTGEARPLGELDGHFVAVSGTRGLGALRVADWQVIEGVHGMSTWVGRLAVMGSQLGIEDRNSGGFYWLDDAATVRLRAHAGELALVEGYVDGPHRVRVLYVQVLDGRASGDPVR